MAMTNEQDILLKIQTIVDDAKSVASLKELKSSIRELQGIALEYGDSFEIASEQALSAAGKLTDRMGDLRAATAAVSGDPIENVGNSINFVSSSLSNLDFQSATTGIKSLATNVASIKLSDLVNGIKAVGTAFLDLGKALLTNPLFLLGAAIALIILNFDKLVKLAGPIGDFFRMISSFLTGITDAIGLTTVQLDKMSESIQRNSKMTESILSSMASMASAMGMSVESASIQYDNLTNQIKAANKELNIFMAKHPGKIYDPAVQKELDDLNIKILSLTTERENLARESFMRLNELNNSYIQLLADSYVSDVENKRKAEILKAEMDQRVFVLQTKVKSMLLDRETKDVEQRIKLRYKEGTKEYENQKGFLDELRQQRVNLNLSIENGQKELNKKLKEINLKYNMEDLDQRQSFLDKQSAKYKETTESQYKLGQITYLNYESQKLDEQIKYENISRAIQEKRFQFQLDYYKNDSKIYSKITKEKEVYETNFNTKLDLLMKESADRINQHYDELRKQQDKYKSEVFQIQLEILKKEESIFTQQAMNAESESQRLTMGANAFKDYTDERLRLQNEFNINQLAALDLQKQAEIAIAKSKGEETYAIEEEYAEKRMMLNAQNEEAITAIKIQQIERVRQFSQQALEAGGLIADIAMNLEKRRLKDGEKFSEKAARNQFRAKQAMAAGSVIVDTGAAIMKAVAASPLTGGMPFSGIAGVMGALQLAKILTTKFEYNAGSSGGGGSITAPSGGGEITGPSMATTPTLFSQGLLNTINPNTYITYNQERQKMNQRVYVVESDITKAQQRVQVMESRANLSFTGKMP